MLYHGNYISLCNGENVALWAVDKRCIHAHHLNHLYQHGYCWDQHTDLKPYKKSLFHQYEALFLIVCQKVKTNCPNIFPNSPSVPMEYGICLAGATPFIGLHISR